MLFQTPASNAQQRVPLAALNKSVPPVQTIESPQSEDNAFHAYSHAPAAQLILASATPVKTDSTFPAESVSKGAHKELDQSAESAHALQD
jgi:hypothetical protein